MGNNQEGRLVNDAHLEVPDVGEEEADEGEGQRPLGDGANEMSCEALPQKAWSNSPIGFILQFTRFHYGDRYSIFVIASIAHALE